MTNQPKCPCACHENKLGKPYEHDKQCCSKMNGFLNEQPKKELFSGWHCCYECGCELWGVPPKEDMWCITTMAGDCPRCGKKNITLIPTADFRGMGD